jgi:protein-S-isoprenylcysteine O-methyltransferase Ste14
MYADLAVAYVGGSLLSGSWWPLLTLPLSLLAVRRVVIEPEERYLAERFGAAYLRYRTTTRRWL